MIHSSIGRRVTHGSVSNLDASGARDDWEATELGRPSKRRRQSLARQHPPEHVRSGDDASGGYCISRCVDWVLILRRSWKLARHAMDVAAVFMEVELT